MSLDFENIATFLGLWYPYNIQPDFLELNFYFPIMLSWIISSVEKIHNIGDRLFYDDHDFIEVVFTLIIISYCII
jgi:hypothetical protein